jgi:hypothetical protein
VSRATRARLVKRTPRYNPPSLQPLCSQSCAASANRRRVRNSARFRSIQPRSRGQPRINASWATSTGLFVRLLISARGYQTGFGQSIDHAINCQSVVWLGDELTKPCASARVFCAFARLGQTQEHAFGSSLLIRRQAAIDQLRALGEGRDDTEPVGVSGFARDVTVDGRWNPAKTERSLKFAAVDAGR